MQTLCETCRHLKEVRTATSRFLLCTLSQTDDRFAKYPGQPVARCDGFQAVLLGRDSSFDKAVDSDEE